MTDSYSLSAEVRDRIDYSPVGEEPHALEEGEWTFLIGAERWRLTVAGFYAVAARSAVEAAEEGEVILLVGAFN
jgi:hypothetical protein